MSADDLMRLQEAADGLGLTLSVQEVSAPSAPSVFWSAEIRDVAAGDGATPEQAGERLRLALHVLQARSDS